MSEPLPIPISIGTRRVHLSRAHVDALFGKGYPLVPLTQLSQPREQACAETVVVRGPAGSLPHVRVVLPLVEQTWVELPFKDNATLGLTGELRLSRRIDDSPGCVLEGPAGTVVLADGVVNALRHLRVPPESAEALGVTDGALVSVAVTGDRARTFADVVVSVEPGARLELVIDIDEANTVDLSPDTYAYLGEPPVAG